MHGIAWASDLLTVYASLGTSILADSATLARMNAILRHVTAKYSADTASFVIGGFDLAGSIALRFTELAWQDPARFVLRPKGVFTAASWDWDYSNDCPKCDNSCPGSYKRLELCIRDE